MRYELEATRLIEGISEGKMTSTAYDTSWFLRLKDNNSQLRFPSVYDWIMKNQHADGSWGGTFETFHDRLISTLAVVIALKYLNDPLSSKVYDHGISYIQKNAAKLKNDCYETIGFELLFPSLLEEARRLGLQLPYQTFDQIESKRKAKLSLIPNNWMYEPETPLVHNLEFLGSDLDTSKVAALLETNDSIGNSPSASAYVSQFIQNEKLDDYLEMCVKDSLDGGICNVKPFEIFEYCWSYYNLLLAGVYVNGMERGFRHLRSSWRLNGVGVSSRGLMPDADDSAIAMKVLSLRNDHVGHEFIRYYHSDNGYLCFPFEKNPSISTNIHLLDAISTYTSPEYIKIRNHIVPFLTSSMIEDAYWVDKWHISPFYATSHAILALSKVDKNLTNKSINWILESQREDGSWGLFQGTMEETAYCIQALILGNAEHPIRIKSQLKKAYDYLIRNIEQPVYPELWIGKGLYSPITVIDSAILSARILFEEKIGL